MEWLYGHGYQVPVNLDSCEWWEVKYGRRNKPMDIRSLENILLQWHWNWRRLIGRLFGTFKQWGFGVKSWQFHEILYIVRRWCHYDQFNGWEWWIHSVHTKSGMFLWWKMRGHRVANYVFWSAPQNGRFIVKYILRIHVAWIYLVWPCPQLNLETSNKRKGDTLRKEWKCLWLIMIINCHSLW